MLKEIHEQPVRMILRTLCSCFGVRFSPPNTAVASSRDRRPRIAAEIVSGCSWISLSMKCSKPPFATSHSRRSKGCSSWATVPESRWMTRRLSAVTTASSWSER